MRTQTPKSPVSLDMFQTPHSRWLAVTHRAPSSHSSFLYGVKSTRIYCRPTCPARLARRANIVFYDTEDQALRDGFRPCKRCKPDNAAFLGVGEELVTSVIALMRTKSDELRMKQNIRDLAKEVGVTPSYLCRVFKKTMGITVGMYMTEFEREVSDYTIDSSMQSTRHIESGAVEMGTETVAETSPPASAEISNIDSLIDDLGTIEDTRDFNFNIDDWFWTEEFLNDNTVKRESTVCIHNDQQPIAT